MSTHQYELHLPRNQVLDTSPDPKMVWKAYLYARDTGDEEEAERLLDRWRSLQPKVTGGDAHSRAPDE